MRAKNLSPLQKTNAGSPADVGAYRIRPTGTRPSDDRSPLSGRLKGVFDTPLQKTNGGIPTDARQQSLYPIGNGSQTCTRCGLKGRWMIAQGRATPRAERHPGDAMHDPSPASCNPPPDLRRAGRGEDCRMRDFFHTVRSQGVALGYRPATFQAAGNPAAARQHPVIINN